MVFGTRGIEMKARNADSLETRVAVLENAVAHIQQSLSRIENRLEMMDRRFDVSTDKMGRQFEAMNESNNRRFETLDAKLDKMNDRTTSHFRWIIGAIIVTFGSPLFIESLKLIKG